jgi:hypothetical protein
MANATKDDAGFDYAHAVRIAGINTGINAQSDLAQGHGPRRSIAIDRKIASSAAVLLVGGISQSSLLDRIQPVDKFATEPTRAVIHWYRGD